MSDCPKCRAASDAERDAIGKAASLAREIERLRKELAQMRPQAGELQEAEQRGFDRGKEIGRAIGWDAAKRDTSKLLGVDGHQQNPAVTGETK